MKANGRLKIDVLIISKNFKLNRDLLLNINIIVKQVLNFHMECNSKKYISVYDILTLNI